MALTHLLDTSVFSQPIKDSPVESVLDRWSSLGEAAVCTSAICLAEVLQGLEQKKSEKYWRRYRELLESRYPVLAIDEPVASQYAKLSAAQREAGRPVSALDLFIAATARRHGLIVATLNVRHFTGIPGVDFEDWSRNGGDA